MDTAHELAAWIGTNSGQKIDYLNPDPAAFNASDITDALARLPRFLGHTMPFYSVAQHSLRVAEIVDPRFRLEALLHDAAEAYMGDIPSPLKRLLGPAWHEIEERVAAAIMLRFGATCWSLAECRAEIRTADLTALAQEKRDYVSKAAPDWGLDLPDPAALPWQSAMTHADARDVYLVALRAAHAQRI